MIELCVSRQLNVDHMGLKAKRYFLLNFSKKEVVMNKKVSSEKVIKDILRRTRTKYSSEEKIRIVLEGIRGEESIANLCRREGMPDNLYSLEQGLSGSRQETFDGRYSSRGEIS